jgi:NAD(P)H-flavin reductase
MVISVTLLYDTASEVIPSEVKQPYSCGPTLMARAFAGEAISTMPERLHHQTRTGHDRIRSGP